MSSKVIIRIGPESEHVDRENLLQRTIVTYDQDMSVVFANVDVYYVIITEQNAINNLANLIEDTNLSDDEFSEEVRSEVRHMLSQYAESNFQDFTERVEKAIKTAHGIGVQKATNRVVNAANRWKGNKNSGSRQSQNE